MAKKLVHVFVCVLVFFCHSVGNEGWTNITQWSSSIYRVGGWTEVEFHPDGVVRGSGFIQSSLGPSRSSQALTWPSKAAYLGDPIVVLKGLHNGWLSHHEQSISPDPTNVWRLHRSQPLSYRGQVSLFREAYFAFWSTGNVEKPQNCMKSHLFSLAITLFALYWCDYHIVGVREFDFHFRL